MRFVPLLILVAISLACLTACRKPPKTFEERIAEIKNDKTLSDEQAIQEFAYANFSHADVKTTAKGKDITAEISFHGWNESRVADTQINPLGGIGSAFQFGQMLRLIRDLDDFIPLAKERGLKTLVATLQTPTYVGHDVEEWVDTYRVRLNAAQIDNFIKSKSLDLEKRIKMAPSLWKVELDRFKEFSYERN